MRRKCFSLLLLGLTALVAFTATPPAARAFPEPASYSRAWQFDFTYTKPQPVFFKGADGLGRWYWYMTYKVTNNSGADRYFIPEFTIATDAGDIVTAGKDVPAGVFDAVKERERNKLMENPVLVVGKLLQGPDHARESIAVWPAFEHDVNLVSVFVAGLSGEIQIITNPLSHEPVTMTKTLQVRYGLPGTGGRVQDQVVVPKGETWVMR